MKINSREARRLQAQGMSLRQDGDFDGSKPYFQEAAKIMGAIARRMSGGYQKSLAFDKASENYAAAGNPDMARFYSEKVRQTQNRSRVHVSGNLELIDTWITCETGWESIEPYVLRIELACGEVMRRSDQIVIAIGKSFLDKEEFRPEELHRQRVYALFNGNGLLGILPASTDLKKAQAGAAR